MTGTLFIGKEIQDFALDFFVKYREFMIKYNRSFNGRDFYFYRLTGDLRVKFVEKLYDFLRNNVGSTKFSFELSNRHKSIIIHNRRDKSQWYKIGLAISDGAPHSSGHIIFSVSTPHTMDSVLNSFNRSTLYPARFIESRVSGKVSCAFNILINDVIVSQILSRLKQKETSFLKQFITRIVTNKLNLAQFLAGVIDGDGCLDKYGVRISVSSRDPLYSILKEIFGDSVSYDEKKYILRIYTVHLRKTGLLKQLFQEILSPHKKMMLKYIIERRKRVHLPHLVVDEYICRKIINELNNEHMELLNNLKTRVHGKYTYMYISVNKDNMKKLFSRIRNLLSIIGRELGYEQDFIKSLKRGNRELTIYNQSVVESLLLLRNIVREGR